MKMKVNLNNLVAKEKSGTLTVEEILKVESTILHNPKFKTKKWKVVNSITGIKYIYCNGQLLPIMKNSNYVVN